MELKFHKVIKWEGLEVDLGGLTILNIATYIKEMIRPSMTELMYISRCYQRMSTAEFLAENYSEHFQNGDELWRASCEIRDNMDDNHVSEEEAVEEFFCG